MSRVRLLRLLIEIVGGIVMIFSLPPQYTLCVVTILALCVSWEAFYWLSKSKYISAFLMCFKKKVGVFMSYLIVAVFGALLAVGYWFAIQTILSNIKEVRVPKIKTAMKSGGNYTSGMTVHGVEWQKDYREYHITVFNEDASEEILDLRADIDFPWVIVKYDINNSHGTQELKLSQQRKLFDIVNRSDSRITGSVDSHINTLNIDAVKLFPKGHFSILIIAWLGVESIDSNEGSIGFRYRHIGNNKPTSIRFPIKHLKNYGDLYIDKNNPLLPGQKYKGHFLVRPQKGALIFHKNGSISNQNRPGLTRGAMQGFAIEYGGIVGHGDNAAFEAIDRAIKFRMSMEQKK